MCGLVGAAGSLAKKEKDAFKLLLHLDIIRGRHSTGVASVGTDGNWSLIKRVGTAWDLFDLQQFNTAMTTTSYALIGHNRAATKGRVNNVNAHPFEFNDVVGAHNGTLRAQWRLPENQRFEVDSENIFYSIQEHGLDETLQNLDGAYALSYWDKRSEEVVLVRNNERTLYYCFSEDLKTVFWASEAWMLSIALSRNDIKYTEIQPIVEESIYRFSFERTFTSQAGVSLNIQRYTEPAFPYTYGAAAKQNKGAAQQGKYLPAKEKEEEKKSGLKSEPLKINPQLLVHKRADFVILGEGKSDLGQPFFHCQLLADSTVDVRLSISCTVAEKYHDIISVSQDTIFVGEVVSYRDGKLFLSPAFIEEAEDDGEEEVAGETVEGYQGKELTFNEFRRITDHGCCACGEQVLWDDGPKLVWLHPDEFVCPECKEVDWVKEYLLEA